MSVVTMRSTLTETDIRMLREDLEQFSGSAKGEHVDAAKKEPLVGQKVVRKRLEYRGKLPRKKIAQTCARICSGN